MLCPVFCMLERILRCFPYLTVVCTYLSHPLCAARGWYFPAVNLEVCSILPWCALLPVFLGLCKPLSGFFASKELERVSLSLMWVESVYRKHPHPSRGMRNTSAAYRQHQYYSQMLWDLGSLFVIKPFYSRLCN